MTVNSHSGILLSILSLGISLIGNAQQNRFTAGVLLNINGIELNGNTSRFWNSSHSTTRIDGTLGFSAGLFVKREFTGKIFSTLELRYISKGSIYEFINRYGGYSAETLFLKYLEIPVLAGYPIKVNKRTCFLETGLAFAKMISTNMHANELTGRTGTPHADDFKNTDISWIGSMKFPLIRKWQENFLFGVRVSRSILSIHKYYHLYNFDYGIEINYLFNYRPTTNGY